MAGRYFQVYLDERTAAAFETMLEKDGRNANAYLKETVKLRMLRNGDMEAVTAWERRAAGER